MNKIPEGTNSAQPPLRVEEVAQAGGKLYRWTKFFLQIFKRKNAAKAGIIFLSMFLTGCSFLTAAVRVINKLPDPPVIVDPTPHPTEASPIPTAVITASPTPVVTPFPTATPESVTPVPTVVPTVVPTPEACVPEPPPTMVSVLQDGTCFVKNEELICNCQGGFEHLKHWNAQALAPAGKIICVAPSTCEDKDLIVHQESRGCLNLPGDRNGQLNWSASYNLHFEHNKLMLVNDVWVFYDGDRGCVDAYGRFFHKRDDCRVLYTNPADPKYAHYSYVRNALPKICPKETPTPVPAPGPTVAPTPTTERITLKEWDSGDRWHRIESNWTAKADARPGEEPETLSGHAGMNDSTRKYDINCPGPPVCDPDHWDDCHRAACLNRMDWDDPRGQIVISHSGHRWARHKNNAQQIWWYANPGDEVIFQYCPRPDEPLPVKGDGCGKIRTLTMKAE